MTTTSETSQLETSKRTATARRPVTWPAWGWSAIGVLGVWAAIVLATGGSPLQPMSQALTLAPYLALVALGQMLVITLGPGNIDVSVGAVVSMSSYVSVLVSTEYGPVVGVVSAIAAGVGAALCSVIAIVGLRVPPIVATLATSLIVGSATLVLADSNRSGAHAGLRSFVDAKILGFPVVALVVLAITLCIAFMLRRTTLGLGLVATGQSLKAARMAGIRVSAVRAFAYLMSGACAGLAGGLLAAFISPSPALGTSYMLDSIAVVVIGGTLISGGRPVSTGVWSGALLFVLLSALLNLVGWSVGAQNVLKGLLVVLVVVVSSSATKTSGSTWRRLRSSFQSNAPNT